MTTPKNSHPYETKPFTLAKNATLKLFNFNGGAAVAVLLMSLITSVILQSFSQSSTPNIYDLLVRLGLYGISIFVALLSYGVALATYRNEKVSPGALFNWGLEHFVPFLGYVAVYILVMIGGLMLLIVPGILFAIWYSLVPLVKIEEGLTLRKSFKRSRELISGHVIEYMAVGVAGFVCSIFGLLGPAPQSSATVEWYKQISAAKAAKQKLPPTSAQAKITVAVTALMTVLALVILIGLIVTIVNENQ